MDSEGRGVNQDYGESLKWFHLAAEQGEPNAFFNLGSMYANGIAIERDPVQAYMWFSLADANGINSSKPLERLSKRLTPDQLEEAKRLVSNWKLKSKKQ
jgi:TPR repeat protein